MKNPDNDFLDVQLNNEQTIKLNRNTDCYGFDDEYITKLDKTDIKNKKEMILYLWNKREETKSIRQSKQILEKYGITDVHVNEERFAIYDADAKLNGKDVILEFKNRSFTSYRYDSVVIDSKKARELYNIYLKTNKKVFLIYTFNDGGVRIFDFIDNIKNYSQVIDSKIQENIYRTDKEKKQRLIHYPNSLTTLYLS